MADHFSLAGRSLRLDTAQDVEPHIGALLDSSTWTSVDLSGNTLGVGACERLAKVFRTLQCLETANLADIFTGRVLAEIPPALSLLLEALVALPRLHTIDLSDNAFGLNTVGPLVDFLSRHVPLEHLILQNNGLGPAAGSQVADALTKLAEKKAGARSLQTVICGRNRLESGSMTAWARMLCAHGDLRTVKMVQNGIRQDGIVPLLERGLGTGSLNLQVLDLQDNTFTQRGAQALANVVSRWTALRELGIGDCLLSASGCVLLAKALQNKQLRILRLQYNEIDVNGVEALLQATRTALPALQRVELNGNKFAEEDPAVTALRAVLEDRRQTANGEEGSLWGLDELSDLEEDSDDEDETILDDADEEEEANVAQKEDAEVDDLASALDRNLGT